MEGRQKARTSSGKFSSLLFSAKTRGSSGLYVYGPPHQAPSLHMERDTPNRSRMTLYAWESTGAIMVVAGSGRLPRSFRNQLSE